MGISLSFLRDLLQDLWGPGKNQISQVPGCSADVCTSSLHKTFHTTPRGPLPKDSLQRCRLLPFPCSPPPKTTIPPPPYPLLPSGAFSPGRL